MNVLMSCSFCEFIFFNWFIKYQIKQHIMGKRRLIFILLAILVSAVLAWNNYNSRFPNAPQEAQPTVNPENTGETPVVAEP